MKPGEGSKSSVTTVVLKECRKLRRKRGVCVNAAVLKGIRRELKLLREAVAVYSDLSATTVRQMEMGELVDAFSVQKRVQLGSQAID
jgi:hypothetical protein